MMARRKSGVWAPTLLVATGILLGWVIYRQLAAAPNSQPLDGPAAVQVASVPDLPPEPEFSMPPLVTFEGVLERPIFSPTRTPPSVEAPVVSSGGGGEVTFKLKGIIIDADQRTALIRAREGEKNLRLPEGGRIGGWTVVTIEPGRVIFARGGAETVLEPTFDPPSRKKTRRMTKKQRRQRQLQQQQNQLQQQSEQLEKLLQDQGGESVTSEQNAGQ